MCPISFQGYFELSIFEGFANHIMPETIYLPTGRNVCEHMACLKIPIFKYLYSISNLFKKL